MKTRMRGYSNRRRRPRSTWAALVTAVVVCALVVNFVLAPVLGLIGAAHATSFGTLRTPVGSIVVSIVISYLVALGFVVLTFLSRVGALAWITAVAAIVATLVGSVWPLVATALASVSQVQDVIPFIHDLIAHIT